nr:MAG TPA: hypothetical protein [Caudoviricetes sp.]
MYKGDLFLPYFFIKIFKKRLHFLVLCITI